jgi:hypothetical protein
MKFLIKNRFSIIFLLVLAVLLFWIMPLQEKLYLDPDYKLIKKKASTFNLWFIGIAIAAVLIFSIKAVKKINQAGNVLLFVFAMAVTLLMFLNTVTLALFLLVNRIDLGRSVDKKYLASYLAGAEKPTPLLHDIKTTDIVPLENLKGAEKLTNYQVGDTVVISFRKGLLGVGFSPEIK